MSNFPTKYLYGPEQISPMDRLAEVLDEVAGKIFPVWSSLPSSAMPDMRNAKEIEDNTVYRINAPGYFYNTDESANKLNGRSSCVLMHYDQLLLDCIIVPFGKTDTSGGTRYWAVGPASHIAYDYITNKGNARWSAKNFNVYNKTKKDGSEKPISGSYYKYMKELFPLGRGYLDATEYSYTVPLPLIRLTNNSWGDKKTTYLITDGAGVFNTMIPIVPYGVSEHCNCGITHSDDHTSISTLYRNSGLKIVSVGGTTGANGTFIAWTGSSSNSNWSKWFVPLLCNGSVNTLTKVRKLFKTGLTPDKASSDQTLGEDITVKVPSGQAGNNSSYPGNKVFIDPYKEFKLSVGTVKCNTKSISTGGGNKRDLPMFNLCLQDQNATLSYDSSVGVTIRGLTQVYDVLVFDKPSSLQPTNPTGKGLSNQIDNMLTGIFKGVTLADPSDTEVPAPGQGEPTEDHEGDDED